jgi:hypothetical protein
MACRRGPLPLLRSWWNPLSLLLLATLVFATFLGSIVAVFCAYMGIPAPNWVSLLLLEYPCCCSCRCPLLVVTGFLAGIAADTSFAGFAAVLTCLLSLVSLLLLSCSCCLCLNLAGVQAVTEVFAAAVSLIWHLWCFCWRQVPVGVQVLLVFSSYW